MNVRFHPAARREVAEAAQYYEQRRHDLGSQFSRAVRDAVAFLMTHPRIGNPLRGSATGCRKWRVDGFPYSVIYTDEEPGLLLLAVAYAKRHPTYWIGRMNDA